MAKYPYNTTRWKQLRKIKLNAQPLCWYCEQAGRVTPADTVDHIRAHRGDEKLMWAYDNLRSCCKACHDSVAALKDTHGFAPGVGLDGMPLDDDHPWGR